MREDFVLPVVGFVCLVYLFELFILLGSGVEHVIPSSSGAVSAAWRAGEDVCVCARVLCEAQGLSAACARMSFVTLSRRLDIINSFYR